MTIIYVSRKTAMPTLEHDFCQKIRKGKQLPFTMLQPFQTWAHILDTNSYVRISVEMKFFPTPTPTPTIETMAKMAATIYWLLQQPP